MKIAILGCGTVASGVIRILLDRPEELEKKAGERLELRRVLARHSEKALKLGLAPEQICADFNSIVSDPEVDTVVELIGGRTDAYHFICEALKAGKNVVTANKDVLAEHLHELTGLATDKGVSLMYEASVGGGIPIIGPLTHTLAANSFSRLRGILNGTTNYILTRMSKSGLDYATALKEAQELGYAEADPTNDVEGYDAARKIAILSSLAFGSEVRFGDVRCAGIASLTAQDIADAAAAGQTVKLIADASISDGKVSATVAPARIPNDHPLAAVDGSFNALYLTGDAVGDVMLYGRGAGSAPTASSVVGDLLEICRRKNRIIPEDLP